MTKDETWWGSFALENHQCLTWKIGLLTLSVMRVDQEWRVAYDIPIEDQGGEVETTRDGGENQLEEYHRYVFGDIPSRFKLIPVLASKSIIFRPEKPLFLAPREEISLYLSSPVWLRLSTSDPEFRMVDIPSIELSDTWFGANNMEGELCYSAKTRARLHIENVTRHPYRAVTVNTIYNNTDEVLPFDRIRIPYQYLDLYTGDNGFFWTQPIHFELESDHENAKLSLSEGPPASKGEFKLISKAHLSQPSKIFRVFNSLIGARGA